MISINSETSCTISVNTQAISERTLNNFEASSGAMVTIGNQAFANELRRYFRHRVSTNQRNSLLNESPRKHLSSAEYFASSSLFRPQASKNNNAREVRFCQMLANNRTSNRLFHSNRLSEENNLSPYQVSPVVARQFDEENYLSKRYDNNVNNGKSNLFPILTPSTGINDVSKNKENYPQGTQPLTKNTGVSTSQIMKPVVLKPSTQTQEQKKCFCESSSDYAYISVLNPTGAEKISRNQLFFSDNKKNSCSTSQAKPMYSRNFKPHFRNITPKLKQEKNFWSSSSSTFSSEFDNFIRRNRRGKRSHKLYGKLKRHQRKNKPCDCKRYKGALASDSKNSYQGNLSSSTLSSIPDTRAKSCNCQSLCKNKNILLKKSKLHKRTCKKETFPQHVFNSFNRYQHKPTNRYQADPRSRYQPDPSYGHRSHSLHKYPPDPLIRYQSDSPNIYQLDPLFQYKSSAVYRKKSSHDSEVNSFKNNKRKSSVGCTLNLYRKKTKKITKSIKSNLKNKSNKNTSNDYESNTSNGLNPNPFSLFESERFKTNNPSPSSKRYSNRSKKNHRNFQNAIKQNQSKKNYPNLSKKYQQKFPNVIKRNQSKSNNRNPYNKYYPKFPSVIKSDKSSGNLLQSSNKQWDNYPTKNSNKHEKNNFNNHHHKCPYKKYIKALSNIAFLQGFGCYSNNLFSLSGKGEKGNHRASNRHFHSPSKNSCKIFYEDSALSCVKIILIHLA